jgi:hypothetical protein
LWAAALWWGPGKPPFLYLFYFFTVLFLVLNSGFVILFWIHIWIQLCFQMFYTYF